MPYLQKYTGNGILIRDAQIPTDSAPSLLTDQKQRASLSTSCLASSGVPDAISQGTSNMYHAKSLILHCAILVYV